MIQAFNFSGTLKSLLGKYASEFDPKKQFKLLMKYFTNTPVLVYLLLITTILLIIIERNYLSKLILNKSLANASLTPPLLGIVLHFIYFFQTEKKLENGNKVHEVWCIGFGDTK